MTHDREITGTIFNIMRFALHDGPGIRTTVFFKGCPLHCLWCHNPESIAAQPEWLFHAERCLSCGLCARACPESAITLAPGGPVTHPEKCTRCGACARICPTEARAWMGDHWSVEQVIKEVLKDRSFYEQSGGGVTFSGGEPLQQPIFLEALLRACRQRGLPTAIDTCGFAPQQVIDTMLPGTDLWLFDLKAMNPETHKRFTGRDNQLILANLAHLLKQNSRVRIRVPLIPGVNDSAEEIDRIGAFIRATGTPEAVHILPYHRIGMEKYQRLNKKYTLSDSQPPDEAQVAVVVNRLEEFVNPVIIGG